MKKRNIQDIMNEYEEKIEALDAKIEECEELRLEWEKRIAEANEAKDAYETLIKLLRKQTN